MTTRLKVLKKKQVLPKLITGLTQLEIYSSKSEKLVMSLYQLNIKLQNEPHFLVTNESRIKLSKGKQVKI